MSIANAGLDLNHLILEGYQHVVESGNWDSGELSLQTGATLEEIREARRILVELRVIESRSDRRGWRAVSPRVAMVKLMSPIDKELQRCAAEAENMRERLHAMSQIYQEKQRIETWDVINSMMEGEELDRLIDEEMANCSTEMLLLQEGADQRLLERDWFMNSRERGLRVKAILQHATRCNPPSEGFMDTAARSGVEFRTIAIAPLKMLIIDRSICILRIPEALEGRLEHDQGDVALVIRHPVLVSVLAAAFEETWNRSSAYSQLDPQPSWVGDEISHAIMQLMATGVKDDAVARRLGISLRTCRRHVSALMQTLGATSRFQAGVEACRHLRV